MAKWPGQSCSGGVFHFDEMARQYAAIAMAGASAANERSVMEA